MSLTAADMEWIRRLPSDPVAISAEDEAALRGLRREVDDPSEARLLESLLRAVEGGEPRGDLFNFEERADIDNAQIIGTVLFVLSWIIGVLGVLGATIVYARLADEPDASTAQAIASALGVALYAAVIMSALLAGTAVIRLMVGMRRDLRGMGAVPTAPTKASGVAIARGDVAEPGEPPPGSRFCRSCRQRVVASDNDAWCPECSARLT